MYQFKQCKHCNRWYLAKKGSNLLRTCSKCGKPIYIQKGGVIVIQLMANAREIVDECVSTRNCKNCSFAENGIHCLVGQPVNWQLAEKMEQEGYWDSEEEEEEQKEGSICGGFVIPTIKEP